MKNVRKLIAAVAAATMLLTSLVQVSAISNHTGINYPEVTSSFTTAGGSARQDAGTYYLGGGVDSRSYARCVIAYYNSNTDGICRISDGAATSGSRSMYLYGGGGNASSEKGAVMVTFHTAEKSYNNNYKVSFNLTKVGGHKDNDNDYATLDTVNWTSGAHINNGASWTRTSGPSPSAGTNEWTHYSATITTTNEAQLVFSVYNYGKYLIDDILITDDKDRVIFSEDFENDTISSKVTTKWTYTGTSEQAAFKIMSELVNDSVNHSLRVYSRNSGTYTVLSTEVPAVEDNLYTVTYTLSKDSGAAINNFVALDFAGSVYGSGQIASTEGTHSFTINSNGNTNFKISTEKFGRARLDDITLADKYGNIVFFEDFEEHDREFSAPALKIDDASKGSINATGTASITAYAANNNESSAFNVYLIAAVYNAAGTRLVNMVYDNATLSKRTGKEFSLSVPVTNGQKLKLFWWDNMTGNIKPVENDDGTAIKSRQY
jgi:hypothetical protein